MNDIDIYDEYLRCINDIDIYDEYLRCVNDIDIYDEYRIRSIVNRFYKR